MTTSAPLPRGEIIQQMDGTYEIFPVPTDEATLLAMIKECLQEWQHIHMGPLIPGAVWEIKPPREPRIGLRDGYLTLDFQDWHLHLCIGEHRGAPPEVARHRRTGRAELYRRLNPDRQPTSWGFRLFNGGGEQQVTILLPNPHLADDQSYLKEPDWSRLDLWDRLRQKYLGIGTDPLDRAAPGYFH
ncbi:MAG: hypothetical protein ACE5Q6_16080, partial [Dehalococcoidia bacterium]